MQICGSILDLLSQMSPGCNLGICIVTNLTLRQSFSTLVLLTFRPNYSHLWGSVLCTVGCLAASLTSTHQMPVNSPPFPVVTKNVSRPCQMSPGGTISPWVKNHCCRGFSCMLRCETQSDLDCGTCQGIWTHLGEPLTLYQYYPFLRRGLVQSFNIPQAFH